MIFTLSACHIYVISNLSQVISNLVQVISNLTQVISNLIQVLDRNPARVG